MKKYEAEIKYLELFNQKVKRLEEIDLLKDVKSIGFRIKFDDSGDLSKAKSKRSGPDQNIIDAFVLTIRFFIRDKDGISFRKILDIYQKLPITKTKLKQYKLLRNEMKDHFRKKLNYQRGSYVFSNLDAFEIIVFGSLAHSDFKDERRKQFESIEDNPMAFQIMYRSFTLTLIKMLSILKQIKDLNSYVINEVEINKNTV